MTKFSDNSCWDTLQMALFYNDVEKVKELIESPLFSDKLLEDCGDFSEIGVKVPFYYITQLWNELLPGEWFGIQNIVDGQKKRLVEITEYLNSRFGVRADLPVDVLKLKDIDSDYNPVFTIEYVLEYYADKDIMTRARVLDLELYCATRNFDLGETERLLKLGANPTILLEECDPESNAYMVTCDDFLEREWWQRNSIRDERDYTCEFKFTNISAMVGSILKERMLKVLNTYEKTEKL